MNKSFKPVIILAALAVFGIANAQPAATQAAPAKPAAATPAPAAPAPAPAAVAPAPAATPAPAPAAVAPVPAVTPAPAPAAVAPVPAVTPAPAPAAVAPVPAVTPAPAPAPAAVAPAPAAVPAPVAETPAPAAPVAADSAAKSAPVAEAPAAPKDSSIILIVEEPVKKKRKARQFAIVDVPANFEIQARKIMPVTDSEWGEHNLDTWWGRANLMVLTESENFVGKLHLRMYPGQIYSTSTVTVDEKGKNGKGDLLQIYEAWAWHRGDYVNIKIGRWDNTARFGSKAFGGYIDAKKDKNINSAKSVNSRKSGFMSTYDPENALQFGLNNFSENLSLDIALISSDGHLDKGDLRVYFSFKDLAGLENVDVGLGYRSNVFDEIYNKYGDVTHTVDFGFRLPLAKEVGILKNLNFFAEAALIGLDDEIGNANRDDKGGSPKDYEAALPILGGLDFSLYHGLDKLVLELEYDGKYKNPDNSKAQDLQWSVYAQKKLNDRFTLNLGVLSDTFTSGVRAKDFSFAGRLQGRIN